MNIATRAPSITKVMHTPSAALPPAVIPPLEGELSAFSVLLKGIGLVDFVSEGMTGELESVFGLVVIGVSEGCVVGRLLAVLAEEVPSVAGFCDDDVCVLSEDDGEPLGS